jgi:hypothetical protein
VRIKPPLEVSNLEPSDPNFVNYVAQILNSIISVVNGEISFVDNFKGRILTVVFNTADLQQAVNHGLNKIPVGYLNLGSKAATVVYN